MNIVEVKLKDIKPFVGNAKKHDKTQVDNVARSIQEFGFQQPVVLDKTNTVIIGHCRIAAAKKLKLEEVPCVYYENEDPEQINKLRLLDNKLNESEWDLQLVGEQIEGLDFEGYDIEWGLDDKKENPDDNIEVVEDEEPERTKKRCNSGDIWQLGAHRLVCGDSTDFNTIKCLVQDEQIDLYITDPPYNVDYVGKTKEKLTISNDSMGKEQFKDFLSRAFCNADKVMREGAAFYIWHADKELYNFISALKEVGWGYRQILIWNKNHFVMGRQDYQQKHEPCFYGWKDGAAHYFIDDRTQITVLQDSKEINPKKMKKDELVEFVEAILADKISTTIINEDRPMASIDHPTMKPIRLIARLIKNSSKQGQTILDSFGGSGSTLMA